LRPALSLFALRPSAIPVTRNSTDAATGCGTPSQWYYHRAGIAPDRLSRTEVPIRGRDQAMTVCTVTEPALLASLLDDQPGQSGAELISA
jgi:hypothetical protein